MKTIHFKELNKMNMTVDYARSAGWIVVYGKNTVKHCLNCGQKTIGTNEFCDESCYLDYSEN